MSAESATITPAPGSWINRLARTVRALGPYGVIELVLPGGTLVLLSLWAIRHRSWLVERARRAFGSAWRTTHLLSSNARMFRVGARRACEEH